jgi:hypothetical protein
MIPISEITSLALTETNRRRGCGIHPDYLPADVQNWSGEALASIIALDHARLTEQVRIAREGFAQISACSLMDSEEEAIARETLIAMENIK